MQKNWNEFLKNEDGSVAVIAVLILGFLLGISALVLDLGLFYHKSNKLQDALDSAALAAAQELPAEGTGSTRWNSAKNMAIRFAGLNKLTLADEDIQPVYQENNTANPITGVSISKSENVDFNFAKVFGVTSGTVHRTASAGLAPAGGITGAVPLSITTSGLNNAIAAGVTTDLIIKCSSNTDDIGIDCTGVSGWFGALRFDGTGASDFRSLLTSGYRGALYVGQVLDMESGNMSGPTMDGFTARYNACKDGCTAQSFQPGCPRLIYIPVIRVLPSKQVQIEAFAAFFITECGGNGNNSYIKASYIQDVVLPNSAPGKTGVDFGIYVAKLTG